MGIWILFLALAVTAVAVIVIFNGLVRLRQLSDNAWADIDVQLKRRHDLVPNLVAAVKGYASHEKTTLESVVRARTEAMNAEGTAARAEAEGALTRALQSLFALVEDYPELRAAEGFSRLHTDLVKLEDALQGARRYYNAVVRDLNTRVQQFPSNLVASAFHFRNREFFGIDDDERSVPQVRLDGPAGRGAQ